MWNSEYLYKIAPNKSRGHKTKSIESSHIHNLTATCEFLVWKARLNSRSAWILCSPLIKMSHFVISKPRFYCKYSPGTTLGIK